MKKLLLSIAVSMVLLFSFFSCQKEKPNENPEVKPTLNLEAVSSTQNSLTFRFNAQNAQKVAYVCMLEADNPTAEEILQQNQIVPIDRSEIVIEGLKADLEYMIYAVSVNDQNEKEKYSDVAQLQMRTTEDRKFQLVASTQFGCNEEKIEMEMQEAGYQVGKYDAKKRILRVTASDSYQKEIVYYFNDEKAYQYALIFLDFSSQEMTAEDYYDFIIKTGWSEYKPETEYEYLLKKDQTLLRYFFKESPAQKTPALMVGKIDESLFSWTRTETLKDEQTGLSCPLVAIGSSQDLITKFELYQGHSVNEERTNPKAQFYAFNTGEEDFPMMGYWMDIASNTYLEECALYLDLENHPSLNELFAYVSEFGFETTNLSDGLENPLFYLKEGNIVCCPELNAPIDGSPFAPKLRFYKQDLTDYLPKETVEIPWPNMDFGKITMEEAFTWYENKGYTVEPTGFLEVFPLVTTNSPDFPQIILIPSDEDENIYFAASILTEDQKVITSPDIQKQLLEKGYVQVENSSLPTFHNTDLNVSAQIDLMGMWGPFSVGFNPIGA